MLKLITEKVGNPFNESGRRAMFALVDEENKDILTFADLKKISEQLKFNLTEEELQEVINNVAGFGKKEITWDQFNKYISKKVDKKWNNNDPAHLYYLYSYNLAHTPEYSLPTASIFHNLLYNQ